MNTFTSVSGWTSQNEHDPLQNNSHDYYTIIALHNLVLPLELSSENVTNFLNILNICRQSFEGGFPCSSVGKESACSARDLGSIPGLRRSPGEGSGGPLQYPCLENFMDRGAWRAASPWGRKESGWLSDVKNYLKTSLSKHVEYSE